VTQISGDGVFINTFSLKYNATKRICISSQQGESLSKFGEALYRRQLTQIVTPVRSKVLKTPGFQDIRKEGSKTPLSPQGKAQTRSV